MAVDPRRLRPGELARLLNSTDLGEVTSERQVYRHRTRAGYRVAAEGDASRVDLLRYAAWLVRVRHEAKPEPDDGDAYEAYRDRKAKEARAISLSGRDIGPLPEVVDPDRRAACERDFRLFCDTYFAPTFFLPWSEDHLRVIAKIEDAVLAGGLFAMAMPRSSGKSSLCATACLWAMLFGHRSFVCLIGADEEHAAGMLESIKSELEHSELLAADFPEVCAPVRALEGITQRSSGQLLDGVPTEIGWTAKEIVLPTVGGSKASGAIVRVAGITGRIRGMNRKKPDGTTIRPSLVLIDDPQTDEVARSPSQCATRERILSGAVLGLAGPGEKIAGLMTLTVVREGDLADVILDTERHPAWQGERTKMVYAFPKDEKLWARYAELRGEGLRAGRGLADATAFYAEHREQMDLGAVVAWPERFNHDELSAIQHAMNLRLQSEAAFYAEYQNEPLPEQEASSEALSADEIASKVSGHEKGLIPIACTRLTMAIDVQGTALYWLVCAWEEDFSGSVIDYGTEPEQGGGGGSYFTLRGLTRTLADAFPRAGVEGGITAGLESLCARTLGRAWKRDDGAELKIERCLIDANWGTSTDLVYEFCRRSGYSGILMPGHGRYVGASSQPLTEGTRKPGERVGLNWRVPPLTGRRAVRHVRYDTNFWKSFVHARLATMTGDAGSLSLFGHRPERHRMIADHLTSEYRVTTQGRGRSVDEWKLRAEASDNHWLDCLVASAVAASMQGVTLAGYERVAEVKRERVSFAEMQRKARAGR